VNRVGSGQVTCRLGRQMLSPLPQQITSDKVFSRRSPNANTCRDGSEQDLLVWPGLSHFALSHHVLDPINHPIWPVDLYVVCAPLAITRELLEERCPNSSCNGSQTSFKSLATSLVCLGASQGLWTATARGMFLRDAVVRI
jgi:hypothetical protein